MILLKIASRNVLVNKRRTLFVAAILTVGCAGMLLVGGFFQGVLHTLREQFIHGVTAHVMVAKSGYYERGAANPFQYLFEDAGGLVEDPEGHVTVTIPRLQFGGLLTTDQKAVSANLMGVDPEKEARMAVYGDGAERVATLKIVSGDDLDPGDPEGILLGRGLAKVLKVSIGDRVSLIAGTKAGSIDGANYRVRGVFTSPVKDFDTHVAKVNLASAQRVLGAENSISSLLLLLRSTELTGPFQEFLGGRLVPRGFEVMGWEERGEFYRNARDLLNQINIVVQIVLAALILFCIASSVNMTFFERMREFGTMMALGNSRKFIFLLVSSETFFIACAGVALGLACGALASGAVSAAGLAMPPLPGSAAGYEARVLLSAPLFLRAALLGLAASAASSLVVSGRTARLTILGALSHR